MQIGDKTDGGIYAGDHNGHHIICSPIEYDLPRRVNWDQVTEYCKSIGMELPTKEELNLLYTLYTARLEYFPKRYYQWYWTSTELPIACVWAQHFTTGFQTTSSKAKRNYAIPIKRIKIES